MAYFYITAEEGNWTCDKPNSTMILGDTFTFTITANEGYELNGYVGYKSGPWTRQSTNFTDDNTKCTITESGSSDITLTHVETVKKAVKLGKFVNLYKVDNDILDKVAECRFRDYDTNKVDGGTFITSLIAIPFDIPEDLITDPVDIEMGYYTCAAKAPLLTNYKLTVNIGDIVIPEKYENAYDYQDTQCTLYLPFAPAMNIATEYIMNQAIHVDYVIDLYSGNTTINVRSSLTNTLIATQQIIMADNIPFIQKDTNRSIGSVNNGLIDNGIMQAYVEITRSIPYDSTNMFGKPTIDYGKLIDYKGYIEVSDIMLNINATDDEKAEIETLLQEGVYIK